MKNKLTLQDLRIGGLPRQLGTAQKMLFEKIFPDLELGQQTDEAIASLVGVSRSYVSMCRKEYEGSLKRQGESQKASTCHSGQSGALSDSEPKNEGSSGGSKAEEKKEEKAVVDSVGHEVPEHLIEVFSRVGEVKERIKLISRMFREVKAAQAKDDPLYANCKLQQLKADIGNVRRNLRFTLPFAVCRFCGGDVNNEYCRACGGRGFVNELTYIATPQELK